MCVNGGMKMSRLRRSENAPPAAAQLGYWRHLHRDRSQLQPSRYDWKRCAQSCSIYLRRETISAADSIASANNSPCYSQPGFRPIVVVALHLRLCLFYKAQSPFQHRPPLSDKLRVFSAYFLTLRRSRPVLRAISRHECPRRLK